MSEYLFGLGRGHLTKKADRIARKHGVCLVNHTDPGCSCGYGCAGECTANRRHWFAGPNLGEPFDSRMARAVEADIDAAGIKPKGAVMKQARKYKGREILPVESADLWRKGYRWTVATFHSPTRLLFAEECRPAFRSLDAAHEWITDALACNASEVRS